ncbi:hypothetical protein PYCCODRAFT_399878 [Trametes coccinea BRFM310]|uniref:Uncharacterized protein n=1 Tax=Trametes coccinea (strain BRFM310) TaxID=1353009 RepID=A0A1Y2IP56_TRAC3|nr:hypothetical protein PYCCODRAFT_399878 [Trametes coccinea BRFM310]
MSTGFVGLRRVLKDRRTAPQQQCSSPAVSSPLARPEASSSSSPNPGPQSSELPKAKDTRKQAEKPSQTRQKAAQIDTRVLDSDSSSGSEQESLTVAPPRKKQKTTSCSTSDDTPSLMIRRYAALIQSTTQASRIANEVEYLYQAARSFPRYVGTFVNYDYVLTEGIARDGHWYEDDVSQQERKWSPFWEAFIYFEKIHEHFPGLLESLNDLRGHPELVGQLAKWMSAVASKARGDDISRLKDRIIRLAKIQDCDSLESKTSRGFKHPQTGRLLCPVNLLDKFDEDPEKFCRMIRDRKEGRPRVGSGDYPAFLYDMKLYVPGKLKPGFLKSKLLVDCAKVIFLGPSSTTTPGSDLAMKTKGKPPICRKMNMREVDICSIIYIAILARFCLNGQTEWAKRDGDFSAVDFMSNVLTVALKSERWYNEITDWFTR